MDVGFSAPLPQVSVISLLSSYIVSLFVFTGHIVNCLSVTFIALLADSQTKHVILYLFLNTYPISMYFPYALLT